MQKKDQGLLLPWHDRAPPVPSFSQSTRISDVNILTNSELLCWYHYIELTPNGTGIVFLLQILSIRLSVRMTLGANHLIVSKQFFLSNMWFYYLDTDVQISFNTPFVKYSNEEIVVTIVFSPRKCLEFQAAIPLEATRRAFGNQVKSKQRSAITIRSATGL